MALELTRKATSALVGRFPNLARVKPVHWWLNRLSFWIIRRAYQKEMKRRRDLLQKSYLTTARLQGRLEGRGLFNGASADWGAWLIVACAWTAVIGCAIEVWR
jgi:hypothetical protein